jgi:hypothetical protein
MVVQQGVVQKVGQSPFQAVYLRKKGEKQTGSTHKKMTNSGVINKKDTGVLITICCTDV